ncbi:hypothetical protein POVWA1_066720 [Plasmodium ovale wallikeri]|uniref:PIR Superfamily Protein n=1 Tax=Plasmodium ovale wallikeri TaxID=864142 RepID=A0A1A9AET6_PLAOA|nr:hypothetical protein POVWA1_066720 [Plasmodium ovale wallikeri]
METSGLPTRVFEEKVLRSNFFIQSLYRDNNFKSHIREIEAKKSSNNSKEIISKINEQFDEIIQEIERGFHDDDDEAMCCRNINYYFDVLYAIINSQGERSKDISNDLIGHIKQKWEQVPKISDRNKCKGKIDLDSICKRSIVKHLHDLKIDKDSILSFVQEYSRYLGEKWGKIIAYTSTYYDKLYVKIENDFTGIIVKYSDFLNSPDFICNTDLDDLSTDDITISTDWQSLMNSISLEKFTVKEYEKGCYNKNYIDMLKMKASSIQRINNILSSGIAILGFSLILVFLYRVKKMLN